MPERGEPPEGALKQGRERTVEVLCEHFARDALGMDEFERRIDRAHRARTMEELRDLLADLPGQAGAVERAGGESGPAPPGPGSISVERAPARRTILAVCGGNSRRGRWVPARRTLSIAVCGGIDLDFREAHLAPGVTEVNALAVMGGIEVVVPPGTYVESDGLAIMGGFENVDEHAVAPGPDDPVIRVRGLAVMGSVEVTVRHPGESREEARRRRRSERRKLKRRKRGG